MILEQQISILEWFLKDEDWNNNAANSVCITGMNSIVPYIHIENSDFKT